MNKFFLSIYLVVFLSLPLLSSASNEAFRNDSLDGCDIADLEGIWNIFQGLDQHISTGSDLAIIVDESKSITVYKDDPLYPDTWKGANFAGGCTNGVASATGYVEVNSCAHMILITRDDSVVNGSSGATKGIVVESLTNHTNAAASCSAHESHGNRSGGYRHAGQAHGDHH